MKLVLVDTERNRLLTSLLRTLAMIGVLAYIPGMWMAINEGIVLIAVTNTAVNEL